MKILSGKASFDHIFPIYEQGYVGVKPGWTRISFPYYMSNEEFEFILAALEFIATYGQRFLTLYQFDLGTGSWIARKNALLCLIKNINYNVHVLPLTNGITATKVANEQSKECKNAKAKNNDVVTKFDSYLKTATEIAHLLPKFPPQRRLHEELDLNFLSFRV